MSSIEFKRADRHLQVSKRGLFLTAGSQVVALSAAEGQFDKLIVKKGDTKSIEIPTDGINLKIDIVYGIYRLVSGMYLAVVTGSRVVAAAPKGQDINVIEKIELFPIGGKEQAVSLSTKALKEERTFLEFIVESVASYTLHYSETYDLTHSQQRLADMDDRKGGISSEPLWKRADARFFWNRELVQDLAAEDCHDWIVPVTSMFVETRQVVLGDTPFRLLFLSRRSHQRQGTRLFVRGADEHGNVANYVETEQLAIRKDGALTSFVQIRGSVPVFWSQLPTLKYAAKIEFTAPAAQSHAAAERHFSVQNALYGDVVCVNLINKTGSELKLGTAFQEAAAKYSSAAGAAPSGAKRAVKYVWFDFHHECRKMRWENLSKLIDIVAADFDAAGHFAADATGKVLKRQTGVMRTNCVDNLDRTNVVQSLFARRSILAQFGLTSSNVLSSPFDDFERVFKNLWADNADQVSVMYSGTGALKTDFTRTGKRTKAGALQDGYNSAMRYYLNNYCDGKRQDAIDLFLSKYKPIEHQPIGSAYQKEAPLFGPNSKYAPLRIISFILVVLLALVTLCKVSFKKLTDRPRLLPKEHLKPVFDLEHVLSADGLAFVATHDGKKH